MYIKHIMNVFKFVLYIKHITNVFKFLHFDMLLKKHVIRALCNKRFYVFKKERISDVFIYKRI